MPDPERGKRVDDGVDNRRRRPDRPGFAHPFHAERVVGGRGHGVVQDKSWDLRCLGESIIHETAREQLAIRIKDRAFVDGLRQSLNDTPVNLPRDK